MFNPRHYLCFDKTDEPTGILQRDECMSDIAVRRDGKPTLPMTILKLAHDEYRAQGHSQSLERIQERGGFGVFEIVRLLADGIERQAEPIK